MAENMEPFHVPQQNRKNKLRVIIQDNQAPTLSTLQTPISSSPSSSSSLQSAYPQNLRDFNYQCFSAQGNLSLSLSVHQSHLLNLSAQKKFAFLGDNWKQNSEMRSSVPLGPFTGYASILKHSRFLKPAQQILDELFGVDFEVSGSPLKNFTSAAIDKEPISCTDGFAHPWQNSKLIMMLDEVYRRYKLCCQQMQSVVASFKTVSGLANAAPYISFAFKVIAKHFSYLKNAILDQIQLTDRTSNDNSIGRDNTARAWSAKQGLNSQNNPVQNLTFLQHPVWRSQRGLPDHAVAVLKTWLFENFLHPYPTDSEKQMLALQTGLSRTQVSNWFINARVRLWKPMVEEIHMLDLGRAQAPANPVSQDTNMSSNKLHLADRLLSTMQSQRPQGIRAKRSLAEIYEQSREQRYELTGVGGSSNVSLQLGLHGNSATQLLQPFHAHMQQPLNLETSGRMNTGTGFGAEGQHLGKDLEGKQFHNYND